MGAKKKIDEMFDFGGDEFNSDEHEEKSDMLGSSDQNDLKAQEPDEPDTRKPWELSMEEIKAEVRKLAKRKQGVDINWIMKHYRLHTFDIDAVLREG